MNSSFLYTWEFADEWIDFIVLWKLISFFRKKFFLELNTICQNLNIFFFKKSFKL